MPRLLVGAVRKGTVANLLNSIFWLWLRLDAVPDGWKTMSEQNGDRARFQKDRKRKLRHRQRIQTLLTALRCRTHTSGDARKRVAGMTEDPAARAASRMMHDEGGPLRTDD